jgi:hypothetical protein
MEDLVVEVGVVKQGFRGNAADVQASTTETSTLLDTSGLIKIDQMLAKGSECAKRIHIHKSVKTHLETFLTGLDSSDVTSDTTTNDNHIVLCYIGVRIISRCAFSGSAGTVSRMPQGRNNQSLTRFRSIAASEASIYGQRRSSNEARRDRLRAGSAEGSPRCRTRQHTPEHSVLNVEGKKIPGIREIKRDSQSSRSRKLGRNGRTTIGDGRQIV